MRILDTEAMSVRLDPRQPLRERLAQLLDRIDEPRATTIVSFQE
jgi:hypothetical protein